jgi:hypothetical protein
LKEIIPDAILVRVSAVSADKSLAFQEMDEFIRTMIVSVPAPLRRVFVT